MFRVRFYVPGDRITVGPGPRKGLYGAQALGLGDEAMPDDAAQIKAQAKLAALLKRDGMALSHTDDAGFACYVKVEPKRAKRAHKPCLRCGYVAS